MMTLTATQQEMFAQADDFHIAPYRADGKTPGTLTWIWSVVVDGELYVRAWNGQRSRWYNAAKDQGAGKIMIARDEYTVAFELVPVADHEEDIFVTTKLQAEFKSYEEAVAAIDRSLNDLNLDYIDMMIIHSPKPWVEFQNDERFFEGNLAAWRALSEAQAAGKIRAIGVSNFDEIDLQNILDNSDVKPSVDQVLAHIGNVPFSVFEYAQKNDIQIEAYSPFGHGEMLKNKNLQQMANKYCVSVAQLGIRYLLQLNTLPLPKATSEAHMTANATVDFTISDDDMAMLNKVTFNDYGEFSGFPVYGGTLD